MFEPIDLAIVGAGPAGLAAAAEAADLGLAVTLVDAFPQLGGQYYRQSPAQLKGAPADRARPRLEPAGRAGTHIFTGASVWGMYPEDSGYLLCLYGPPGTPRRLRARQVILATGAYERPAPFPGWTLPGVMTAGAALTLVKHQRLLPGRRVLLTGTGPLQWTLAYHLLKAGADVVAVLDANPFPWRGWRFAHTAWGQWERLREGWSAWRAMMKAGTPLRWSYAVRRAEGEAQVEQALIGPVVGEAEQRLAVDTICLGYGFTPSVQLACQAGCATFYDQQQRTHLPMRDEGLQTTLPGVYAAGDGASLGGKDVAQWEGRLAAIGAARQLGRAVSPGREAAVHRQLARQRRFAVTLAKLFPIPAGLETLWTDDMVLCRCEEITAGEVRRAVAEGAATLSAVRRLTRAGMGRCQGRMCSEPVLFLAARELHQPPAALGQITPRPPVMPMPLEGLVEDAE